MLNGPRLYDAFGFITLLLLPYSFYCKLLCLTISSEKISKLCNAVFQIQPNAKRYKARENNCDKGVCVKKTAQNLADCKILYLHEDLKRRAETTIVSEIVEQKVIQFQIKMKKCQAEKGFHKL